MTAVPILLADHVATEINSAAEAGNFDPLDFAARRSYPDWDIEFQDLSDLAVDVVYVSGQGSGGSTIELESASSLEYTPQVDVVVRRRFEPVDRDENGRLLNDVVDPLATLVQSLHELFVGQRQQSIELDENTTANWVDGSVMSWVNQWKLRQGMFEGVVRIQFTASRAA